MGKVVDLNERRYEDMIRSVVSRLNGKDRDAAANILSTSKAKEAYEILLENKIPANTIRRIMTHSLENFQREKGLTVGSYALGVAEELAQSEKYAGVVEDMYKDGVISERQYNNVRREIYEHVKDRSKNLRQGISGLEKLAASIFGIFGIGLLLFNGPSITGEVVGVSSSSEIVGGLVAGLLLSAIGLFLFLRSFKN